MQLTILLLHRPPERHEKNLGKILDLDPVPGFSGANQPLRFAGVAERHDQAAAVAQLACKALGDFRGRGRDENRVKGPAPILISTFP